MPLHRRLSLRPRLRRAGISAAFFATSLFALSLAPLGASIPTSGLVAEYLFNTGTPNADSSGNNSPSAVSKNGVARSANRFGVANTAWDYDGIGSYAEIADSANFSVSTTGYLTVCAWVKPVGTSLNGAGELLFSHTQGTGYVHYLGKGTVSGSSGNQEWAFRLYSADNTEGRHNRMSCYLWPYSGGLGPGSYFQDTLTNGGWIHVVAIYSRADHTIWWYKNGVLRDTDCFSSTCSYPIADGDLRDGDAPLRVGTRDLLSFFKGSIDNVLVYNRKLTASEITQVYNDTTN